MSASYSSGRSRVRWYWIILTLIPCVLLALFLWSRRKPSGPRLLNKPTKAREVRPFTKKRDSRFDPLPIEKEKHGK